MTGRRWWIGDDGVVAVEVGRGALRQPEPPNLGTRIGVTPEYVAKWIDYLELGPAPKPPPRKRSKRR